jgi:hypothetical protein
MLLPGEYDEGKTASYSVFTHKSGRMSQVACTTIWRQYHSAFWCSSQFQTLWTQIPGNWFKKESFLIGLSNFIVASTRI